MGLVLCEVLSAVRVLPDPEPRGKEPTARTARTQPPPLVGGITMRAADQPATAEVDAAAELAVDAARANADFAEMSRGQLERSVGCWSYLFFA